MSIYEKNVIRPILNVIEIHQDFLCRPENLPQLAKLGFMFEKLWGMGRLCYGYSGILMKKGGSTCENNPKYELGDTINYNSSENENIIYDAWGMHVTNDGNLMNFEEFNNLILNGKELTEFEIKSRKTNKTFDEWVDLFTDKRYEYSSMFIDRRRVADYLLCTIGTGYGYNKKSGMIIKEAGGADQDQDGYGSWENSKFTPEIQVVIEKVLAYEMTKIAMDEGSKYIKGIIEKREKKEHDDEMKWVGKFLLEINKNLIEKGKPEITIDDPVFMKLVNEYLLNILPGEVGILPMRKDVYDYYPISSSSIITMFDKNTHPSYINAGLEICEDIIAFPPKIKKGYNKYQINQTKEMIKFANDFIKKWKLVE